MARESRSSSMLGALHQGQVISFIVLIQLRVLIILVTGEGCCLRTHTVLQKKLGADTHCCWENADQMSGGRCKNTLRVFKCPILP